MKKIGIIILVLVLLVIGAALARDIIIKNLVEDIVAITTGLKMDIGELRVSVPKTYVSFRDVVILNPDRFNDKTMLDIPEIYIDYKLLPLLKKEVRLQVVRINLKEFVVIKGPDGKTNLEHVKGLKGTKEDDREKKKSSGAMNMTIDNLLLKIGKVIYKDYSGGGKPAITEYNINIDARYKNVKKPEEIIQIIVAQALMNTAVGKLTDFKQFKEIPIGALEEGKDILKKTVGELRNLLESTFKGGK